VRRYGRLVSARISLDLTGGGLEEWRDLGLHGVVIADVVDRREEAALIGFVFAPGTDTEAIATALRERWRGSMLARWAEAPDLIAMPGARPGFILAIEGGWGEDEAASNDALAALMRARENGTLAALLVALELLHRDLVGVEGEVIPDLRHAFQRVLVGPCRVGDVARRGRDGVVAGRALVGAARGAVGLFQEAPCRYRRGGSRSPARRCLRAVPARRSIRR
jgi:hypothetical protein